MKRIILHLLLCLFYAICVFSLPKSDANTSKIEKRQAKFNNEENAPNIVTSSTTATLNKLHVTDEINVTKNAINKVARKPLKLYPKQKVILNQILQVYTITNVENNTLCKKHSEEFAIGLRAFEAWALKMFDSSSKLQAGIFNGNLMEFGSFKQCINIYYESQHGPIRGQQCVIKITPTTNIVGKVLQFRNASKERYDKIYEVVKGASILWSVCVPDSCTPKDVLKHFNKTILSITQGLDLNISVTDYDCYALKDINPLGTGEWIVIFILALLIVIVIISTVMDVYSRNEDETNQNKISKIFSAYANTEYIFSNNLSCSSELDCLNGFRFISILYVVVGHRFVLMLFYPSVNTLEINEWLMRYTSTIITGGTVSVDTFFMISGLLVTYHLCSHLEKGQKFKLWHFYLRRYIRLTPSLAVVVMILAVLSHRFGSGPLWKRTSAAVAKPCQYFWWSALLHIQNYVNAKHICILQSWYLTCDTQFYLFSPFLIYPLFKWPVFGKINCVVIYCLSVITSFYVAWVHEYEATDLITNRLPEAPYFLHHYIQPYVRSPTYIMGIGLGYALYKTKEKKIKMSRPFLIFGWLVTTSIVLAYFWGCHLFQMEYHKYRRLEQSFFLSLSRSGWTLSMAWIVWVCVHGYGGIVNTFLSAHFFRVMGRISFSIFLFHMQWQFLWNGALKMPLYFSDYAGTERYFSDFVIILIPAFLLTICVECPVIRAENMFLGKGKVKTKIGDSKVNDHIKK